MSRKYIGACLIFATSNVYERLFSKVDRTLTDRRRRINPTNLEYQIFQHMNHGLWGQDDVSAIGKTVYSTSPYDKNNK